MKKEIGSLVSAALLVFILAALIPGQVYAEGEAGDWTAHVQATYIYQEKNAFDAAYSGANSLTTEHEKSYSVTATAFLGVRPWSGGELYFNPEIAAGIPLSDLTGLGGMTNGEIARTSGTELKLYRARLFLKQTWNFAGESETVGDGANQLAATLGKNRFSITVGNLSLLDSFDSNRYSHDARAQFLNWALVTYGAYDFASDARGYTWGAIAELYRNDWIFRLGRAMLPERPNQLPLDTRIFRHFGDQLEIVREYEWNEKHGAVHVLGFRDRAELATYRDALMAATHSKPDINAVRTTEHDKFGVGVALEQDLGKSIGLFARAMWADGATETEAYAAIDRSLAIGAVAQGTGWGRTEDTCGLAFAWNGISSAHRDYLAAGGLDFFIGDGRLNYGLERIPEAFYNFVLVDNLRLMADFQYVSNPAYNRDRGPVTVAALRIHVEF